MTAVNEEALIEYIVGLVQANSTTIVEIERGTGPKTDAFLAFPSCLVYWDATLYPEKNAPKGAVGHLSAINGKLVLKERPRIAVIVFGVDEPTALAGFSEVKGILNGRVPTLAGVQEVIVPLHSDTAVVSFGAGNDIQGIVGIFELDWLINCVIQQ